jgi:hypothetical protein
MINDIIVWHQANLLTFQIISFFVSVVLLSFVVYFIIRLNIVGEKIDDFVDILGKADISQRRSLKAWKQIQKRLKTKNNAQLKLAVIEADRILDEILKRSGYQGGTADERLKQITLEQLSNISEILQARRIRNRIALEPDFEISPGEAESLIEIYKKAFQEFGLID